VVLFCVSEGGVDSSIVVGCGSFVVGDWKVAGWGIVGVWVCCCRRVRGV